MAAMRRIAPAQQPKITVAEFEKMPQSYGRYELIDGGIVAKPVARVNHSLIARRIIKAYDRFDPDGNLGMMLHEVNFHLNDTYSPAPDVIFWKADRAPKYSTASIPKPDLAVEIQSNDQSIQELTLKALAYLAGGVPLVWVIQPNKRIAAIFRQGQVEPETVQPNGILELGELLPGFSIVLSKLFEE